MLKDKLRFFIIPFGCFRYFWFQMLSSADLLLTRRIQLTKIPQQHRVFRLHVAGPEVKVGAHRLVLISNGELHGLSLLFQTARKSTNLREKNLGV